MEELQRLNPEAFKMAGKTPCILVLDNVRSALNIGSVFRTADAFCMESIAICGISCCPPNREINKSALGATETVSWKYYNSTVDCIEELKEKGYLVLAIEQVTGSVFLNDFSFPERSKIALVFGNEVEGVAQEVLDLCDGAIEIPQGGTKHSLNIAVSTGIVAWEVYRQYSLKAIRKP